ncbi:MAG: hypothetical protein ACLFTR_03710 [Candidatus Woesearchaeota archaeon]
MNIEYIFLVPIIVLGLITSYTDIKSGMIRNKHIKYALYGAFVCHMILVMAYGNFRLEGYSHYIINSVFMLVISFIFWNVGLWTAGDAKLFFTLNVLTPPSFITTGYMGAFYGIVYFTNIFGLLLLFFLYKVIRNITMKEFKKCVKDTFNPRSIGFIALFVFGIGMIGRYIPQPQPSNFLTSSLIFFVILMLLRTFVKDKLIMVVAIMAIARLAIDYEKVVTPNFWINYLKQLAMLLVLKFLLLRASFYAFTKKVRIEDLKEKMFLAEDIIPDTTNKKRKGEDRKDHTRYTKRKMENLTIISYLQNRPFKFHKYDKNKGLSIENLDWLKEQRRNLKFGKIRVYETMAFAPFIFAGVILTIIVQGNIFMQVARILIGN